MKYLLEQLAILEPDSIMIIMTLINIVVILSVFTIFLVIDYQRIDSDNCYLREKERKGLFKVAET